MECNKDEAVRAKEIAEKKFVERNYAGAKKFALKAQNLFPGLEGLSQMVTTLDVYISADNKINGESDWYGILGAGPYDDDEAIRKQYRKLALMLHPDKNKAVGAEGAFKLVSEAWGLLSDKNKRQAYNQKRGSVGYPQKVSTKTGGSSTAAATNGGYQHYKKNVRAQQNNARGSFATAAPVKKNDTFWTICNRCKTHYEYMRMYLNHTLLCPNCHEAFMASERDPPPNVFKQSNWSSRQSHSSVNHTPASGKAPTSGENLPSAQTASAGVSAGASTFKETIFQWGPFSQTGDRGTAATSTAAAQAASVVQQASEKVKRQREERQSATEWEKSHLFKGTVKPPAHVDRPSKKSNMENNHPNGYRGFTATGNGGHGTAGLHDTRKGNFEASRIFGTSNAFVKPDTVRDLSYLETRNMLISKAKTEIRKKLQELRSSSIAGMENKEIVNKKQNRAVKGEKVNANEGRDVSAKAITVPDSDFHNFDLDRTEDTFKEEQVWASYDDDDGMPRFYVRIHKVVSLKPFKMRISWLNSRSNSELGPIDWIGRGFTKTSGEFRIGKHESAGGLNTFSHMVCWEKGPRGAIRVYPKKGQVWALYKNWSPEWDSDTPEDVRHKYEMVEVVESFNEEQGVSVALLDKVPGFKTVFQSHSGGPQEVRRIPKEELFRLSHQVPYHVLTGVEADNALKGCLELDPAATPLELIQAENAGKAMEETSPRSATNKEATAAMEIDDQKEEEVRANGKQAKEEDR